MNKKLPIIQLGFLLITLILLITVHLIHLTVEFPVLFIYVLFLFLTIVYFFDLKKKHVILNDRVYSVLMMLVCTFICVVVLRSMLDSSIIAVEFMQNLSESYQMIFLKSNAWFINISLILLLVYRFTYDLKLPKISVSISIKSKS